MFKYKWVAFHLRASRLAYYVGIISSCSNTNGLLFTYVQAVLLVSFTTAPDVLWDQVFLRQLSGGRQLFSTFFNFSGRMLQQLMTSQWQLS